MPRDAVKHLLRNLTPTRSSSHQLLIAVGKSSLTLTWIPGYLIKSSNLLFPLCNQVFPRVLNSPLPTPLPPIFLQKWSHARRAKHGRPHLPTPSSLLEAIFEKELLCTVLSSSLGAWGRGQKRELVWNPPGNAFSIHMITIEQALFLLLIYMQNT